MFPKSSVSALADAVLEPSSALRGRSVEVVARALVALASHFYPAGAVAAAFRHVLNCVHFASCCLLLWERGI